MTKSKVRVKKVRTSRGGRLARKAKQARKVASTAVAELLSLSRPRLPIAQRKKMEAVIARIEKENAAAGVAPIAPPVVDLGAPVSITGYQPGKSTIDRIVEAQDTLVANGVPAKRVFNTWREQSRRILSGQK
jgi:hypothetical protein